jgi:hypothetical protein
LGTIIVNAPGRMLISAGVKPAGSPSHWMGTGVSQVIRTRLTRPLTTSASDSCCLNATLYK